MAEFNGSMPQFSHGGDQFPVNKMPGAVPNGVPPQWGQEVDFKTNVTSQTPAHVTATNGTRSSSQLSHPGSLSSHSSRDSSPAPSRIGVVHPNAWSPVNAQNHGNQVTADNPTANQIRYQQPLHPSPIANAMASSGNQSLPPVSGSSNFPTQAGQRMPLVGQVAARVQAIPNSSPASLPRLPTTVGNAPSPVFGQPPSQAVEAVESYTPQATSQPIAGNHQFIPPASQTQPLQTQGGSIGSTPSSNILLQGSGGPLQYSQAPSNISVAQQQHPIQGPGQPRPLGQAFPSQAATRMAPPTQIQQAQVAPMQVPLNMRQPLQASQAQIQPVQQPPLSQMQPVKQSPSGSGQITLPGLGQQVPYGSGQQFPHVSAQQAPIAPPAVGQQLPHGPPGIQQQSRPSHGHQLPPGSGQQVPYAPRTAHPGPGAQYPPPPNQHMLSSQGQHVYTGQQFPMPVPSSQWSSVPAAGPVGSQRPTYPPQQISTSASQPYVGQPPVGVVNTQLSQPLSGPSFQRSYVPGQPTGPAGNDMGSRRYPHQPGPESLSTPMSNLSVTQAGFNKLWGQEHFDLLQSRNILPPEKVEEPKIRLVGFEPSVNCSPDIFRCTLTRIPETDSLLKKSRLPLGVLIHPFRDLANLPVIQCTPIVRCRVCRTYINPFVYFMDEKHWKCNLCFRVNELPDEFNFDPATKTYGEPMRRPEIKSATIEFIAPAEYMLRPPQPAVYLFLLDVSRLAVESGYLQLVCETLLSELDRLPGDGRTSVGFITYDSSIHFYSLAEGLSAPQQMVVMDIDDVFLPCPENLLANRAERKELIQNLLLMLPTKFSESYDTGSALGAALQAAFKLMSPTGGRVTVFQCCLPNKGPGALKAREDPANRASKDVPHLNPATDFYKQLALEFSGQQTAVDMFLLNQQYSDLATLSGFSRFSGGCIYHFPLFQSSNIQLSDSFESALRRYLERKIGFEAVMRIRCSRGLSIHTFHGNFYVRSTDLLSLPNINPDAGFGMQVSIEENLSDMQNVCFQAALLYTSGKGERRIRVHTLCLPIAANLPDILHSADQQCIIGLLAKMAVDRSQQSSLSDARDAFINVVIDALSAYKATQSSVMGAGLLAPTSLRLLPLYILALLKNVAFRSGTNTRLDDRFFAMCQMKTLPLSNLIQFIYPDLYPVHCLDQLPINNSPMEEVLVDNMPVTIPPRLHLSAEKVNSQGAFLLDAGDQMLLLVGRAISPIFCENVLGVSSFSAIPEDMFELPEIDCEDSRKLRNFLTYLQSEKPYFATLHIIREDSKFRSKFFERLIEDRTESSLSYYEFLQHIKNQIK
ncbi:Protein transport protein Sec24B [Frankliniella fusca]|uniref:Protein transport protein Sec24B n=1 Tax=Frankliniella fusca TaxID=407009 RepID=A0AAE1H7F7_9NEOP|nr:Protein transport protein Sec24B [Frankliniella fusca]